MKGGALPNRPLVLVVCLVLLLLSAAPGTLAADAHNLAVSKQGAGTVTSSPAGIDCGATCSASFEHGTAVTLTGTSDPGRKPVAWSGCDSVDAQNRCLVAMNEARSVRAVFRRARYRLVLTKVGSGRGIVARPPGGIGCGRTCTEFAYGKTVILAGRPAGTSLPASWSGCDAVDAQNRCVVRMTADRAITVRFDLIPNPLKVSKQGAGTVTSSPAGIDCGSTCQADFVRGTKVILTGTPASGAQTVYWKRCGVVDPEDRCLVRMKTARQVVAIFKRAPAGKATPSGTATVRRAKGSLKVTCKGGPCSGTFKLTVRVKHAKKAKKEVAGRGSFGLAAGASSKVRVKITNGRVKKLLKRGKTVKSKLTGVGIESRAVKLKPAKKKKWAPRG